MLPESVELRHLAIDLAMRAGELLLTSVTAGDEPTTAKTSPTDVVTAVDHASESLIVDGILQERPDDGILAEEGAERSGSSGITWVIDPLDGTVNYVYGIPYYAVSIAATAAGVSEVGVVHAPQLRETYVAVRGAGATLNGEPLKRTTAPPLEQALVATGFPYVAERRASHGALVARILPEVRDIRRLGSAALDFCGVAAGHVDGYFERNLRPWDAAAGALIAEEAGCSVELIGDDVFAGMWLTTAPGLESDLRELLI